MIRECIGFGCPPNEGGKPGCVGLECKQVPCEGGAKTTVTGTVFDPAGKVPAFNNATVYAPNADLADIPAGASGCERCDADGPQRASKGARVHALRLVVVHRKDDVAITPPR